MFPRPLCAHLALLIAYVVAASTAPPTDVPSESSFAIASPPGSRPTFDGGSVNYDSTHVTELDDPGVFTTPAPGESVSVANDRPATYSFTQSGAGDDSIERPNSPTRVGVDDTPKKLRATVEGVAKAKRSRNLIVSRHVHNKRFRSRSKPKFADCLSYQKTLIKMAAEDAQGLLVEAIAESERVKRLGFRAHGGYYKIWFGEYSEAVANTVWSTLEEIKTNLPFLGFTYDCNCNEAFPSEIIIDRRRIRICRPFWDLVSDEKSGQLVRMAGQRMPTILDFALGPAATRRLTMLNPEMVSLNLDNYVAFVSKKPDPLDPPPPYDHPPPYVRPHHEHLPPYGE